MSARIYHLQHIPTRNLHLHLGRMSAECRQALCRHLIRDVGSGGFAAQYTLVFEEKGGSRVLTSVARSA